MDSAEGHKGGKRYFEGKTFIHKIAIESIASHRGVNNGKNTTKGNGNGTM
jgi:hypothetical protein